MSSMLASIRKGKVNPLALHLTEGMSSQLKSPELIPARIDCAALDILQHPDNVSIMDEFGRLPKPVPPYPLMWLESKVAECPVNAMVLRRPLPSGGHRVGVMLWWDFGKGATPTHLADWDVSIEGSYVPKSLQLEGFGGGLMHGALMQVFIVAHWCARSQCKNARLTPIPGGRYTPRSSSAPIPMSSWRELEIFDEPKTHSTGQSIFPGEARQIRCTWVRGHFADYRFGSGHFGRANCKYVLWIPEHKRGDENLGTIKPGYIVH